MKFTHRPTGLPGGDPEKDRSIYVDGLNAARVMEVDAGPRAGQWHWNGRWSPAEGGFVGSLDEALAEIKKTVTPERLKMLPLGS